MVSCIWEYSGPLWLKEVVAGLALSHITYCKVVSAVACQKHREVSLFGHHASTDIALIVILPSVAPRSLVNHYFDVCGA